MTSSRGMRPDLQHFNSSVRQLLSALGSLHRNIDREDHPDPILHNDIKPENILLADRDRPILVDFGAASRPHIGMYQGTEGYVAPDLRSGEDRKYCEDGDLFAIAVTLHEWLFGSASQRPGFPRARYTRSASSIGCTRAPLRKLQNGLTPLSKCGRSTPKRSRSMSRSPAQPPQRWFLPMRSRLRLSIYSHPKSVPI